MEAGKILVDAYGDDSVVNDVAVFGLVVVPTPGVPAIEGILQLVKAAARVPADAELHCRVLFHPDARRKSPWAHLSDEDVWAAIEAVPRLFGRFGLGFHVGVVRKGLAPKELEDADGVPGMPLGDKQLLWFAFSSALLDLDVRPGFDRTRLWIDPDRTKVPFVGRRRQMRHVLGMKMFSNISGSTRQLQAEPIAGSKPPLLQVADVLAYTAAQALSGQALRDKDRYRKVFAAFHAHISESFPGDGPPPVDVPPIAAA